MCGIFGVIQARPFKAQEISAMGKLIRHRGPDDEGFLVIESEACTAYGGVDTPESLYSAKGPGIPGRRLDPLAFGPKGGLVLGHRRLSILDLSAAGHQPMLYLDRYWIVFNGEVYNYIELQAELRTKGYAFNSHTDTEVVLAAYDCWGADCLSHFNGMWGLAIYDRLEETLFLARDRFGVKPLYLWVTENNLAFASEIKAFTALAEWKAQANPERMLDYLVWSLSDHTEETLFKGVVQLPPGGQLLLKVPEVLAQLQEGRKPSYQPARWYSPASVRFTSEAEAQETFRALLTDAIRLRLRADVPVGSCLSGGLDSSAVVCLMQKLLDEQGVSGQQRTFTACSAEKDFDESDYARVVIERTGVKGIFTTPEPDRLFRELEALVWSQDEPFASTSIFAQKCVFSLAKENQVTVMLDGQGADEILCGYRGFVGAYLAELFRGFRWPKLVQEVLNLKREIGFSPQRSLGYMAAYTAPSLIGLMGRFDGRAYSERDWLAEAHQHAFTQDPIAAAGGRSGSIRKMSLAQLAATNLPMLLRWEDRNSMACSIEARTPFLDYRVVEACLGMPAEYKIGGGVSKRVLRGSMRGIVPDRILDRKDKMGFVTAENTWLKGEAKAQFRKAIQESLDRFPGMILERLLTDFDAVTQDNKGFDHRYWRVINLGYWGRAYNIFL